VLNALFEFSAVAFYCCADYLALGLGCYSVVYLVIETRFAKISGKAASLRQMWREIRVSLFASAVGTGGVVFLVGRVFHRSYFAGITDPRNNPHGIAYSIVTIAAAFLFFDLFFYLSHRFVFHSTVFYRRVHYVHHQFGAPTPWARCAFSWIEQALYTLFGLIPSLLIPMNLRDLWISFFFVGLAGLYQHLGYEIAPRAFLSSQLPKVLTTPTHHALHHNDGNSNFSLLINYDYFFRCQNPRYEVELEKAIMLRGAGTFTAHV